MVKFRVTDEAGETLVGPDGRPLEFSGANAWGLAVSGARPRFRGRKLLQGATTDGAQQPHRGPLFIVASEPLKPSGESRWELHQDGSTTPCSG